MLNKTIFSVLIATVMTIGGATTGLAKSGEGGGLTEEEEHHLMFMREEEKLARDSYWTLGGLWGLVIFDNIAESEQRHMDAIKKLIDKYKLEDPILGTGEFADPYLVWLYAYLMDIGGNSMKDGLYVGALIEETDIVDIQHAIDATHHEDINDTYESLMCGSRNHLRAFIRQIESNGGSYTPTVLVTEDGDESEFWDIAYSEMEHDCGKLDDDGGKGKGKGKGNR